MWSWVRSPAAPKTKCGHVCLCCQQQWRGDWRIRGWSLRYMRSFPKNKQQKIKCSHYPDSMILVEQGQAHHSEGNPNQGIKSKLQSGIPDEWNVSNNVSSFCLMTLLRSLDSHFIARPKWNWSNSFLLQMWESRSLGRVKDLWPDPSLSTEPRLPDVLRLSIWTKLETPDFFRH